MKNQAVVAIIEFYDSTKLGDSVQTAVYISDMLKCPVKMKHRLGSCHVEIKVEVIGKIESDCGLRTDPMKERCHCSLKDYSHSVGDHK